MKTKFWIIAGFVVAVVFCTLFVRFYRSSPGFVSEANEKAFSDTCHGLNILLNREATYADAPGISLCIGILR